MIKLEINKEYKYEDIYNLIQPITHPDPEYVYYLSILKILNDVFNAKFILKTKDININKVRDMFDEKVIVKQEHIDRLDKEIAMFLLRK